MEITGSQKIKASRQQVFDALLNPEVLKHSVPGCESAEFVDFATGRELKLTVSPSIPGLKGPYTIFLRTEEVVAPSHLVLIAQPKSSLGEVLANCAIDLKEEIGNTLLSYTANAQITGKIAATPDMIIKGAVKMALDQFFKNFEKQVSAITA